MHTSTPGVNPERSKHSTPLSEELSPARIVPCGGQVQGGVCMGGEKCIGEVQEMNLAG